MTEQKSRFRDLGTLAGPLALKGLTLRPKGTVVDPKNDAVTYVGRLAEATGKSLMAQIDELKAERESGMVLVTLDPEEISITDYANRHTLSLSSGDEKFEALKLSIKANGQDTPVRIRPAVAGAQKPYELVEGHRRLAAIRLLNGETEGGFRILARIDAKCDEALELVKKMYRENAEREDLSPYETGRQFAHWIGSGLCKTQEAVGALTGLKQNTVSQYLTIANLPIEILEAFGDPRQIALRWNVELARVCKDYRPETLECAKKIAERDPRPGAAEVFRELIAASSGAKDTKTHTVMHNGKTLYAYSVKRGSLSFTRFKVPDKLVREMTSHMSAAFETWLTGLEKRKP
jgi:ParB family transcriptional regulator, chromosome partitioning protein